MSKGILTNLRNDWLIQELIVNSIPVPALSYFIWTCFPFAQENKSQFFWLVIFATGICFTIGFAARKLAGRKIAHVVNHEGIAKPEELMAAKVQASHFPFVAGLTMSVRWSLLAGAFVPFPFFLQGKISGLEFLLTMTFLIYAAIGSLPFCYLCSERALSPLFSALATDTRERDDKGIFKLGVTSKILLLNLLSIIPLAGNFCTALIVAHYQNISLASIKLGFFLLIAQALILTVLSSLLLSINIRKVLVGILDFFENIAKSQGNLNRKIVVGSNDELGDLAHLFNLFLDNLRTMIVEIKSNSDSLDVTSNNLAEVAASLNERAELSSKTSNTVASSSEEMGASLNSICQSMDEASENVNNVAASTEEMSSTVNEIAEHSAKARTVTETAVENVESAKTEVDELGINAHEIDKVTEVISEISEQTNLLALNATIEAARAGEAGKGFSVVANEIKELAKQTSEATAKIKHMVAAIQSSSAGTTEQINRISGIIKEVNNYVASIAAAVEQQSNANHEISAKVSDVSQKNQVINTNISQITEVTNDIVKDISQVSQSVDGVSEDSKQVRQFGKDMAALSANLQQLVARFNLE